MINCKHGNGQDCQKCQHERDTASGYPWSWKLWEYQCRHCGTWHQCSEYMQFTDFETGPGSAPPYRRRPDADEMIEEWKRRQKTSLLDKEADENFTKEDWRQMALDFQRIIITNEYKDKCANCRHDYERFPLHWKSYRLMEIREKKIMIFMKTQSHNQNGYAGFYHNNYEKRRDDGFCENSSRNKHTRQPSNRRPVVLRF